MLKNDHYLYAYLNSTTEMKLQVSILQSIIILRLTDEARCWCSITVGSSKLLPLTNLKSTFITLITSSKDSNFEPSSDLLTVYCIYELPHDYNCRVHKKHFFPLQGQKIIILGLVSPFELWDVLHIHNAEIDKWNPDWGNLLDWNSYNVIKPQEILNSAKLAFQHNWAK